MLYRNEPVLTESYRNAVMDEVAGDIMGYIAEAKYYEDRKNSRSAWLEWKVDDLLNLYDYHTSLGW